MKRSEGKQAHEEIINENLLPALADFLNSGTFRNTVSDFLALHASQFEEVLDSKSDDAEFSHEHKAVFDKFQVCVDELLGRFAEQEDVSTAAVFQCCRDAVDNRFSPLFAEDDNQWIVETLMGYLDFNHFLEHMRRQHGRRSSSWRK